MGSIRTASINSIVFHFSLHFIKLKTDVLQSLEDLFGFLEQLKVFYTPDFFTSWNYMLIGASAQFLLSQSVIFRDSSLEDNVKIYKLV